MTAQQRFMLVSLARPFTPTIAFPDGVIGADDRQQLVFTYAPLGVAVAADVLGSILVADYSYGAVVAVDSTYGSIAATLSGYGDVNASDYGYGIVQSNDSDYGGLDSNA